MQTTAGLLSGTPAVKRAAARWAAGLIAAPEGETLVDDMLSRPAPPVSSPLSPRYCFGRKKLLMHKAVQQGVYWF